MNAITAVLEKNGAKICRQTFNGQSTPKEFKLAVSQVLSRGCKIYYTPLKAGTVVPPNMEGQPSSDHRATWQIAYVIEGIRDWLFAQRKP